MVRYRLEEGLSFSQRELGHLLEARATEEEAVVQRAENEVCCEEKHSSEVKES